MKILFYTSLGFLAYIYLVYPGVVLLLSTMSRPVKYDSKEKPSVSLLIAARNEELVIEDRITNIRKLNYPDLEILIGSDGSTDHTINIARETEEKIENFRVFDFPKLGKSGVLNQLHKKSTGDILVFSDTNSMPEPDAITNLVSPFTDPEVGCVIGNLKLSGLGIEKIYWKYRKAVRKAEYRLFGTTVGVNGALWAIRKELFHQFPRVNIADDLWLPLQVARLGYAVAYRESAVVHENTGKSLEKELSRRVRVISNTAKVIKRYVPPLNWFGFQYLSRKFLWQFMPLGYLGILISNFFLIGNPSFLWLLIAQMCIYALGSASIYWNLPMPWSAAGFVIGMQWALVKGLFMGLFNFPVEWEINR